MDINRILSSPTRDDEIRKLIVPKPWNHEIVFDGELCERVCSGCKELATLDLMQTSCSHPDPIALNWNLAMKMFKGAEKADWMKLRYGMLEVYKIEVANENLQTAFSLFRWWALKAQPHHYLLAAVLAKEGE